MCLCVFSQSPQVHVDLANQYESVEVHLGVYPLWTKTMCAYFLSFFTVVASVFCLPASCSSEWYALGFKKKFHSPKPFADLTLCVEFFLRERLPLWSSVCSHSDRVVKAHIGLKGAWHWMWINAGSRSSLKMELVFLLCCQWCMKIPAFQEEDEFLSQLI